MPSNDRTSCYSLVQRQMVSMLWDATWARLAGKEMWMPFTFFFTLFRSVHCSSLEAEYVAHHSLPGHVVATQVVELQLTELSLPSE
jgi:hypothetical protein